jgi:hypothetical protein
MTVFFYFFNINPMQEVLAPKAWEAKKMMTEDSWEEGAEGLHGHKRE